MNKEITIKHGAQVTVLVSLEAQAGAALGTAQVLSPDTVRVFVPGGGHIDIILNQKEGRP
jgi:hypothetical protein